MRFFASKAAIQARAKRLSAHDRSKARKASRRGRAASTRRISASSRAISAGCRARRRLGGKAADPGGEGGRAALGQERGFEREQARLGIGGRQRRGKRLGAGAVLRAAGGAESDDGASIASSAAGSTVAASASGVSRRIDAERGGEAGGIERTGEGGAVVGDLLQERVGLDREVVGEAGDQLRMGVGEGVEQLLAQGAGLALLDHGELRRDPGLEREAAQERLAEGVDRLDSQAPRGLEGAGEEGAGAGEPLGGQHRARLAELGERVAQRGVAEHRPVRRGCGRAGSASRRPPPWCR